MQFLSENFGSPTKYPQISSPHIRNPSTSPSYSILGYGRPWFVVAVVFKNPFQFNKKKSKQPYGKLRKILNFHLAEQALSDKYMLKDA